MNKRGLVVDDRGLHIAAEICLHPIECFPNVSRDFHSIAIAFLVDRDFNGFSPVDPHDGISIFRAFDDFGHIGEPQNSPAALINDGRLDIRDGFEFIQGTNEVLLTPIFKRAPG